jgi:salicylate hydroxylase
MRRLSAWKWPPRGTKTILGRAFAGQSAWRSNEMARTPRVLIVGGGIGGLAAALALERARAEVIVCEQSPKLSEIGAGIGPAPNAIKALRALGLEDKINAIAYASEFAVIRAWKDGRPISRAYQGDYSDKFGAPSVTAHRADLLGVLAGSLRWTDVRLGLRCVGVESHERGAAARFADGSAIEADIVIGADGIHSKVRESLFGANAPRFTGCICFRGMAPVEAVPRDINTADVTLWMGPHGHVVHYPVRRGELLNIVAHIDSDAWTEESWTRECGVDEVTATYARWNSALTRVFPASERWYKWALYDRDPPARWNKGRATLLGDSAHAMLPYLGQGAAMAIEDGCVLAGVVARGADDLDGALAAYERTRLPRVREAVLGSRARARDNHLTSPLARLTRDLRYAWRRRFGGDQTVFQAGRLYNYDAGRELA